MKKKYYITFIVCIISIILIISLILLLYPLEVPQQDGKRKAIILCSANDYYGSEEEEEFRFDGGLENWIFNGEIESGHNTTFGYTSPGSIYFKSNTPDPINVNFTYSWNDYNDLDEFRFYNISALVYIDSIDPNVIGIGARIGLRWINSSGDTVRIDWSNNISSSLNQWNQLNIMGICNNESNNQITDLDLILSFQGSFASGHNNNIYYDDVIIDNILPVNSTDPFDPTNRKKDADGFPAQALQVYKILKNHGYSDENILLMLYHTGDSVIDINSGDGILNDLINVSIDIENNAVNASRFKYELNSSISGSFASRIKPNDQLIIFMTDHGSNKILPDGNATFHFEADNSFITEKEFFDLIQDINCKRMMINVDCCYSGNFINKGTPIGSNRYEVNNLILISSSEDLLSWYWIDNKNMDGFAGSWFFHVFWDQLNMNQTIGNAFNFAVGFIPSGQNLPLIVSQIPLIYDNMGINRSWGFNSIIKL